MRTARYFLDSNSMSLPHVYVFRTLLFTDSLNSSADMETEVGPSDIDDNEEDVESSAEEFTPGYNSGRKFSFFSLRKPSDGLCCSRPRRSA